jgi:hypothetical protein
MTAHSGKQSGLDRRTYFMVRMAALAATGAAPAAGDACSHRQV